MKMFEFIWNKEGIRETEKAIGLCHMVQNRQNAGIWEADYLWLPKSQIEIEDVEYDGKDHFWHEGDVLISVPMWLAREHDYFKYLGNMGQA